MATCLEQTEKGQTGRQTDRHTGREITLQVKALATCLEQTEKGQTDRQTGIQAEK